MPHAAYEPAHAGAKDLEVLQELNRHYVRSAESSDVRWYEENLAEDFLASNSDGSLINRTQFLARMAQPYPGRYTDVYARRQGRWLCVSAHFNRF